MNEQGTSRRFYLQIVIVIIVAVGSLIASLVVLALISRSPDTNRTGDVLSESQTAGALMQMTNLQLFTESAVPTDAPTRSVVAVSPTLIPSHTFTRVPLIVPTLPPPPTAIYTATGQFTDTPLTIPTRSYTPTEQLAGIPFTNLSLLPTPTSTYTDTAASPFTDVPPIIPLITDTPKSIAAPREWGINEDVYIVNLSGARLYTEGIGIGESIYFDYSYIFLIRGSPTFDETTGQWWWPVCTRQGSSTAGIHSTGWVRESDLADNLNFHILSC